MRVCVSWVGDGLLPRAANEEGGTLQQRSVLNNASHVRGEPSFREAYAPV